MLGVFAGLFNESLYTTFGLFHLHICQVCGSFQCPYCPHYNSAPALHQLYMTVFIAWLCTNLLLVSKTTG